jgi:hypothetical protein
MLAGSNSLTVGFGTRGPQNMNSISERSSSSILLDFEKLALLLLLLNIATFRSVAIEREYFSPILLQQAIHVYKKQLEILWLSLAWILAFHPVTKN